MRHPSIQARVKLTPKLVGTAGLEPAASRFQAEPSAADITPRKIIQPKSRAHRPICQPPSISVF
jgi:hypothetical protein